MMFVVLGAVMVPLPGAATLLCLVQGVLAMVLGIGSFGGASLLTYLPPGIAVDVVLLIAMIFKKKDHFITICIAGAAANLIGSAAVNGVVFGLASIPLILMLILATVTGCLGGYMAYIVHKKLKRVLRRRS